MSVTNATLYPIYAQAWDCPVYFFNPTTNAFITGWGGSVASITLVGDGGAPTSIASPNTVLTEAGSSGCGILALTGAQMTNNLLQVVAVISAPTASTYVANINTINLVQRQGNASQQTPVRFEDLQNDLWAMFMNWSIANGSQLIVSTSGAAASGSDSNTKFVASTFNNSYEGATKNQLTFP